jgi:hypothetical protein
MVSGMDKPLARLIVRHGSPILFETCSIDGEEYSGDHGPEVFSR